MKSENMGGFRIYLYIGTLSVLAVVIVFGFFSYVPLVRAEDTASTSPKYLPPPPPPPMHEDGTPVLPPDDSPEHFDTYAGKTELPPPPPPFDGIYSDKG